MHKTALNMREVSRVLWEANDIKIGRNTIFKLLREASVLNKRNQPNPRFQNGPCFSVIKAKKSSGFKTRMTLVLPEGINLIRKVVLAAMEKNKINKPGSGRVNCGCQEGRRQKSGNIRR
jgi:phage antirepressor YoqD-like protein